MLKSSLSLRIRYLMSLLLIAVPLLVFSFMLSSYSLTSEKRHIEDKTWQCFQSAETAISGIFSRCSSVVEDTFSLQNCLYRNADGSSVVYESSLCDLLGQMEMRLNDYAEVICMFRGDVFVYTADNKIKYQNYEECNKSEYNLTGSELFTKILSSRNPSLLRISAKEETDIPDCLACIVPVSLPNEGQDDMIFVFWLMPDKITSLISSYMGDIAFSFFMYSSQNVMCYFENSAGGPSYADLLRLKGTGVLNASSGKERYIVFRSIDSDSNLVYAMTINEGNFYRELHSMQSTQTALLCVLVVMLCLLAISLTMALYAPIRALYSKVTHQEKASFRENELLSISNSFESTAKEAAVLEDRVMNLSSIARNQFLVRLLNGCYTDAEEICRLCAQYDLRYDAPLFFVIFAAPFPHAIERRNLPATVENCLKNLPVSVTSVEIWQENTFCFILNTNDASARIVAADALQNMYSNAENIFLRFGVGGVYGEISEIADSFVEAAIAARLSIHKNVSLYERRLVPDGNKGEHLDEAFSFLKEALQRGEETVANRVVAEIISSLSDLSDSFLIFRFHTAKIISLLQEQFRREEIPFSREYLESLLDYHSNTEFSQKVTEAIAFLCRAVKERMENQDRQTRKCLLEYIKANFTRYDFSMDDVLARFDISQTYAMSILQQATNMTFAKYIAFLRMEEFKRLLIQTDRNVGDCVKAVGYNDAPSFMRKFKLQEGVTPSQFRAQHWR